MSKKEVHILVNTQTRIFVCRLFPLGWILIFLDDSRAAKNTKTAYFWFCFCSQEESIRWRPIIVFKVFGWNEIIDEVGIVECTVERLYIESYMKNHCICKPTRGNIMMLKHAICSWCLGAEKLNFILLSPHRFWKCQSEIQCMYLCRCD